MVIPLVFIAIRLVFAPLTELCGDEAYYWVWSRSLSWGYLDHPPMVAWLIRASTGVLGSNELAVRLPGILLAGGTIMLATYAGHLLGLARKSLLLLQVVLLCFPMLQVAGAIFTPDTPALFFALLTLVAALLCLNRPENWASWWLLGLAAGLAMLSKYTALLPVAAILTFLLIHSPRRWYKPVLAGVIAIVVISPMLYWNYERDWLSFAFQLSHGTSPDGRAWYVNFGDFIAAQAIVANPLLMPLLVYCGVRILIRPATAGHRLLAVAGLVTLFGFAATSLLHKVEANWPTLTWIPLIVLLVTVLPSASARLSRYTRIAIIVAGISTFVLMLPPSLLARLNKHSPLNQVDGWGPLAQGIRSKTTTLPIICTRYQDASLFAFYISGQPDIRVLRMPNDRISHYDQLPLPELGQGFTLVTDHALRPGPLTLVQQDNRFEVEVLSVDHLALDIGGRQMRGCFFGVCTTAQRDATTQRGYIERLP